MIFLLVAAALVAGAPLVAAVLVSVASLHEDAAKSLAGHPPSVLASAARRLLHARMGGSGPLLRLPRSRDRETAGPRSRWRPWPASRTGPINPGPQWPADDEGPTHTYDAVGAPRG